MRREIETEFINAKSKPEQALIEHCPGYGGMIEAAERNSYVPKHCAVYAEGECPVKVMDCKVWVSYMPGKNPKLTVSGKCSR